VYRIIIGPAALGGKPALILWDGLVRTHADSARSPVSVFKINPVTGERLSLLAAATLGEGGWVDLTEPIIVLAGEVFVAVSESSLVG
jgi:hypothetical protein